MAPKIAAGQRWVLKRHRDYELAEYGAGATVIEVGYVVRLHCPGPAVSTLIDLDTDSGVALRGWSPGQLRTSFKLEAAS